MGYDSKTYHDFSGIEILPKYYFYCSNGMIIKNPNELPQMLLSMPDSVFRSHVNADRNDFYSWINEVFTVDDLGNRIRHIKDRVQMAASIQEYINNNKPNEPGSIRQETPVKQDKSSGNANAAKVPINSPQDTKLPLSQPQSSQKTISKPPAIPAKEQPRQETPPKRQIVEPIAVNISTNGNPQELQKQYVDLFDKLYQATSDLRKAGVDTKMAELRLMMIGPKIKIFGIIKENKDAEIIKRALEDVAKEIDDTGRNFTPVSNP